MTPVPPDAGPIIRGRRSFFAWLAGLTALALVRPAKAEAVVVEMRQLKFAPEEIEIAAGGRVAFVNLDLVPHTATASDKSFDTGTLRKGEREEVAFSTAGEFPYVCKFHRHMTGRILVR